MKNTAWIAAMLAGLVLVPAAWATTSFQTDPINGFIAGAPGETVGWGFTLDNDVEYLVPSGSSFVQTGGDAIGSYTDVIGTQFNIVGTGSTPLVQTYDTINSPPQTGLGSFTINPAAPVGDFELGTITISYDLFTDSIASMYDSSSQFTVDVEIEVVPEPATFGLAGMALIVLGWMRRSRHGARS